MLLPEEDTEVFKRWVLPKLETISDADAEVLADYVVALVTTDDTDANVRRNCIDSLTDFLQDNTAPFVDEVIRTLKSRSFKSLPAETPAPIPSIVGTSTSESAHAFNPPKGPASRAANRLPDRPSGGSPNEQRSRKRKQNDRDTDNDRPVKQTARRGGKGRGNLNAQAPAFAPMPAFNPGLGEIPPFDPTNPMSFLAMAAAFGINLPGMPPLPTFNAQEAGRCVDYDTKGFCAVGSLCPYRHDLEYDPDQPAQGMEGSRNRGRQSGRAPFSLLRPTRDRSNTTIVVEQIPEDFFSEEHVRDFFGKFGTILDVRMQVYKRLAVVKFETHDAANAAYTSPKVIFDNRFVKVYWHKSDVDSHNSYDEEEMIDPEEIARRQAEAQLAFEERRKKEEEAAAKAEELDRKLQETNAEILRVRRELARISGDVDADEDMSQDLATLQAEAENLFAQQDAVSESWRGSRGMRGYRGRARGSRGGYRGRGAWTGVKRLDNRARRIAIKDVEPGSRKDEALRQHLFNTPDLLSTTPHPESPNTLLLTFAERYQAESFIDSAHTIPDVGVLDMEWVSNEAFGGVGADAGGVHAGADAEGQENAGEMGDKVDKLDEDMDVAEDEDQWL